MDEIEYTVTWTMSYLASSPEEAVRQAVADLDTVTSHPSEGPNVFIVSSKSGDKAWFHADKVIRPLFGGQDEN
jgi:hypothetical protein